MMATEGESRPRSIGQAGLKRANANVLVLPDAECWSLLRNHKVGRLAIVIEGSPRIFPINYAAADNALVFRTEPGAKLRHGPGSTACFEIDDYDQRDSTVWSVMVVGALEDITEADDERSRGLRRLPVEPAAPGTRLHWLALNTKEVSGRRFRGGWIVPGHYLG
jgi:nitroimidazol reductase NimA-like FMN-containing flavoprotein (pyridoxamine 5'-phosphate oxidase superfamily)